MLTMIRERAADALLRPELLCGEANFRTLAEAIACAVFISHGERLHYVNHAAETITGYAREELLSMSFWDLVHPDCRELFLHRGGARHGDAERHEVKILTKNNDRYGHLIGSQALCRLADVLRVFCRAIDTAARYGGDEFVVILPETTAVAAKLVASRIRSRLAADSLEPRLSASIGVAVYPQDGATIEALLRTADRELYAMKPV